MSRIEYQGMPLDIRSEFFLIAPDALEPLPTDRMRVEVVDAARGEYRYVLEPEPEAD